MTYGDEAAETNIQTFPYFGEIEVRSKLCEILGSGCLPPLSSLKIRVSIFLRAENRLPYHCYMRMNIPDLGSINLSP